MRSTARSALMCPTMGELLSNIVSSRGGDSWAPLSYTKKVYIEVDELIKRHDARVKRAYEKWLEEFLY